jgi:hypothetical protein
MRIKKLHLDDHEDTTYLTAELDPRFSGIELFFRGIPNSIYAIASIHNTSYGIVDKKIMYRFCQRMIKELEKEGIKP